MNQRRITTLWRICIQGCLWWISIAMVYFIEVWTVMSGCLNFYCTVQFTVCPADCRQAGWQLNHLPPELACKVILWFISVTVDPRSLLLIISNIVALMVGFYFIPKNVWHTVWLIIIAVPYVAATYKLVMYFRFFKMIKLIMISLIFTLIFCFSRAVLQNYMQFYIQNKHYISNFNK